MADPGEDFSGFMDYLNAADAAEKEEQRIMAAHELWRQTTLGGWMVRQIQAVSTHFAPFLEEVINIMSDDSSISKIVFLNFVRMVVILVAIGFVLATARIFQKILGTDIIQEEEIVIVHEYATEEEAAKARAEQAKEDKKNQ